MKLTNCQLATKMKNFVKVLQRTCRPIYTPRMVYMPYRQFNKPINENIVDNVINPLKMKPKEVERLLKQHKPQKAPPPHPSNGNLPYPDLSTPLEKMPTFEEIIPVVHATKESTKITVLPNKLKVASVVSRSNLPLITT